MTDNINDKNIIRPCIDENNICITPDNRRILNCILSDNGDIKGITEDNVKALYSYKKDIWLYGSEIGYSNLIPLTNNKAKARELGSIGGRKAAENREKKKNFNELAKSLLEMTVSDKMIKETLENPETMLDDTYGSLILAAIAQGAKNGSFKCAEFIRDTAGYKPKNEIELQADIMTESDKALIDKAIKTG